MQEEIRNDLIQNFVIHLSYYRGLSKYYDTIEEVSRFWSYTINAHLLQASIYWNMIFGNHKNNDFHWKHGVDDKEYVEFNCFLKSQGIEWESVWKKMNDFRDKYAAHRDKDFKLFVPHFDEALQVVYFYSDWLKERFNDSIFIDCRDLYEYSYQDAIKIASKIIQYNEISVYKL